jgi:hypothetical protein
MTDGTTILFWWITGNGVELRDLFKIKGVWCAWTGSIRGVPSRALPAQIALTSDVATTDWYPLSPQSLEQYHHGLALRRPENYFGPKRNLLRGIVAIE